MTHKSARIKAAYYSSQTRRVTMGKEFRPPENMQSSGQYHIWLHRFTILLAVATLFLVVAGASVTSKEAGLSVPDWPLSYGQVMPEMTGGVVFEQGHRMVA